MSPQDIDPICAKDVEAMLAEAYDRGWREGCEDTLQTGKDDPFNRCCVPHRDVMGEGCGTFLAEVYPKIAALAPTKEGCDA